MTTPTTEQTTTLPALDAYGHVSGEVLGKFFMRQVNSMSSADLTAFVGEVTSDHRTLQQSAAGVFLNALLTMGAMGQDGNFDGRDEFSKRVCMALKEFLAAEQDANRPGFRLGQRFSLI